MTDAKNSVSETTATTGGAGVGQTITLTGAENSFNPTFQQAFGGAATDIPIALIVGDDFQTCRVDFNGTNQLTVQSIQSTFIGGVYNDTNPTGVTLSGTPIAQCTFNATDFLKVDTHIEDLAIHFSEAAIDHTNIQNRGSNTHAQIDTHIANVTTNPHQVDQGDVGLGNVDNTSDLNKPISTATQIALDTKVQSPDAAAAGSTTITHMVGLTQAEYDGITPDANTFYAITG